jgi:hypothetical protein
MRTTYRVALPRGMLIAAQAASVQPERYAKWRKIIGLVQ